MYTYKVLYGKTSGVARMTSGTGYGESIGVA